MAKEFIHGNCGEKKNNSLHGCVFYLGYFDRMTLLNLLNVAIAESGGEMFDDSITRGGWR